MHYSSCMTSFSCRWNYLILNLGFTFFFKPLWWWEYDLRPLWVGMLLFLYHVGDKEERGCVCEQLWAAKVNYEQVSKQRGVVAENDNEGYIMLKYCLQVLQYFSSFCCRQLQITTCTCIFYEPWTCCPNVCRIKYKFYKSQNRLTSHTNLHTGSESSIFP